MNLPTNLTQPVRIWRASGLLSAFIKRLPLLACFLLATSTEAQQFVLFGNQLVNNLSTVNGDVGVSAGGNLDLNSAATINGNLFLDTTATLSQLGIINGTTFNNQDLSGTQSSVFSTSALLASLPPNQTISGNQTSALNFNVPVGTFVVNLNGGLDLNNQNITLTGGGTLILNIENSFSLAGSASIVGNPANIIVNYMGTSTVTTGPGDAVDGTVFLPTAAADLAGLWTGVIYGGGDTITLDSGAEINPVPEPGSMVLISTALASVLFARRRFCSMKS